MQSPIPSAHLSFHNLAQPQGSLQPPLPSSSAVRAPPSSSQLVEPSLVGSEPEPPTPKRFIPTGDSQLQGGAYGAETAAKPNVYTAVYSSIPVFECMVRGIAVMRRRSDAWMNATQILKVAGIEKGKRTKILEKDIIPGPGPYEKVQGGYGKYQGTWLPLDRSLDLATLYGVNNLLAALFDHNLSDAATAAALPTAGRQATPSKPRNSTAGRPPQPRQLTLPSHPSTSGLPYNPNNASPFQPVPHIYHHPIQPASHGGQLYGGPQASQAQMMTSSSSYPQHFAPQQYQPQQASSSKRPRQDDGDEEARRMDQLAEEHRRVAAGAMQFPGGGYHGGSEPYGGDSSMGPPSSKKMRPSEGPPYQGVAFQNSPHLQESTPSRSTPVASSPSAVASSSRQPIASGSALPPPPPPVAASSSTSAALNGTSSSSTFPPTSSLVPFTRFASKPSDPANNPDPSRQRALLLGFFDHTSSSDPTGSDDPVDPTVLLPDPSDTFDPNLVIDSYGHTALHWACSLSRPNLVSFLLARGADPHRGNYAGETPLIRSVLATNHYDTQSFAAVLSTHNDELSSTLRTLDTSHRTVLHHIALVAGMKGRAASARYYLEAVLEWIAKNEGLGGGTTGSGKGFRTIVDIVDCNGDTALNIAARVGNRSLVGLFLSVQADKTIPNKMGLRAGDYGCEEEALRISPAEEAVAAIREPPPGPIQKSKDVIADLTKTIESLSESFLAEIKVKQDVLTVTESHLRGATKTLSSERRRIKSLRSKLTELDSINIRIKNVQLALVEEEMFDWSGRYGADGSPVSNTSGGSFVFREDVPSSVVVEDGEVDPSPKSSGKGGLMEQVVELRRIAVWQERVEGLLKERIRTAEVKRREKEVMFRKIIAICSNVPLELIGSMLDTLITAVESDGEGLDVGRVTGFMNKVRQQQQQSQR